MTTNRTPIARRSAAQITPRALAAFKQLRVLEAQCVGPPDCEPYRRCGACEQWWRQQRIIRDELGLRPWEFAVEREGTGDWPADEGARARWRLFEEAEKGICKVDTLAEPRRFRNVAKPDKPKRGRRKRERRAEAPEAV